MTSPERHHVSVEKRPAFEPPTVLATPVTPPASMPRPAATAFGAVLVWARVAAGIAWLVGLGLGWDDIVRTELEIELEGRDSQAASDLVLTIVIGAGGIVLGIYAVLALLFVLLLSVVIMAVDSHGAQKRM